MPTDPPWEKILDPPLEPIPTGSGGGSESGLGSVGEGRFVYYNILSDFMTYFVELMNKQNSLREGK